MKNLVDPRLESHLPNHWPSTCEIRTVSYAVSASNQRIKSGAVTLYTRVPCRMSPLSKTRTTDNEARSETMESALKQRILKLNGYFPLIVPRDMDAVVDGVVFPIRGVENDSQRWSTRLFVEDLTP